MVSEGVPGLHLGDCPEVFGGGNAVCNIGPSPLKTNGGRMQNAVGRRHPDNELGDEKQGEMRRGRTATRTTTRTTTTTP